MKFTNTFKDFNSKLTFPKRIIKLTLLKKQNEHLLEVANRFAKIAIGVNDKEAIKYINENIKN